MRPTDERRYPVSNPHDIAEASRAAMLFARRAGFSVMRQFRVAGLVNELAEEVVSRSGHAIVVLRDESDGGEAKVRVTLQGRKAEDSASFPADPETAASWASRWNVEDVSFESGDGGPRMSMALGQPKLH